MGQERGADALSALALDLDGTLTTQGLPLKPQLVEALRQVKGRGVALILATGRCLGELEKIVPPGLFEAVVAENGAMLFVGTNRTLFMPPNWAAIRSELVKYFEDGCEEVIISVDRSVDELVRKVTEGLNAQVIYNKDRVMIMPPGVDKGTGLRSALTALGVSPQQTLCIGDGENDLPMFEISGSKVALSNSVDSLKRVADYVTNREDGEGTIEAIGRILRMGAP